MAAAVAYRNIMRAARVAFEGDAPTLLAAQSRIRDEFRSKQALDPKDSTVSEGIEHATQVAQFLRQNVVQGKKMEGEEKYSKLKSPRIHTRPLEGFLG
ncbi:zinc maintenance protein 1 [Beauveria bassiana D1-5]|uniref:Mitochondrial zinc maintenance protein 1, mitochondrial n=1 Tax=Beauveria bassiana D1-5 TaxID=1245745 RepID=A0A0A2VUF9_BEABA|nr:zinc maintenance protein 1 [Beauveria bassiana D1-5]